MVASAVARQSAEETGIAAQRISRHGADLSSRAARAVGETEFSAAAWSVLRHAVPGEAAAAGGESPSPAMTVRSGTAPYESQLRKKRQRGYPARTMQGEEAGTANGGNGEEVPNPWLFHQPEAMAAASEPPLPNPVGGGESSASGDGTSSVGPPGDHGLNTAADNTVSTAPLAEDAIAAPPSPPVEDANPSATNNNTDAAEGVEPATRFLREGQAVPSSRVGRAFGFATLGAGLVWGTVGELTSRLVGGGSSGGGNAVTTDANADRLAATLCRMRGAALKMGQMLSIQDETLLPPALTRALKQVRQGADAMPNHQLVKQLRSELGDGTSDDEAWRSRFRSFEELPFAAASIGQVHRATVVDKETGSLRPVVVKVQYPGVAQSIESDLGNLNMLVKMSGLAPKGLFIENVMRVGRDELKVECNYLNEMANQETFQDLVRSDPILRKNKFVVPDVFEDLTTELVITTAYAPGGTIDKVSHLDQEERNRIGRTILYLTMQELFAVEDMLFFVSHQSLSNAPGSSWLTN